MKYSNKLIKLFLFAVLFCCTINMRIDRRTKKTKKADPEVSSASPALGFVKKLVEETVTSCKDFHFAHVDSPKASITDTDFQEDPVLHSFFHYVKELKLTKELEKEKEGEKAWVHYLCVVQSLYQYVPYHNKLHPGFILLNVLDWIKNGQTLAGKPVDEDDHFSHLEQNEVFVSSSAIALAVSVLNHDIAHPGYAVFGPGDAQTTEPFKYFYNESNFQQEPEEEGDYPKPLIKGMFLELGHGLFAVEILEQFKEQLPGTFGKRVKNSAEEIEKIKGYYTAKLELSKFNWVLDRLDYGKKKNPGERPVVMNIYQTILMTAVGASKPIITKWSNDKIKNNHVTHGEIALSSLLMKAADLSIPFAKDEHTRFVLSSFVNVEFVKKDDEKKPAPELARSISCGQGYFKNGIGEPFFKLAENLLFNEKAKIAGEDVVPGFIKTQNQILEGLGTFNKKGEIKVEGNPERQKLFKKIFDAAGKLRERSPKVKNTFAGDDEQKKAYAKMVAELKKRRG